MVIMEPDKGVLIGASDPRKDGMLTVEARDAGSAIECGDYGARVRDFGLGRCENRVDQRHLIGMDRELAHEPVAGASRLSASRPAVSRKLMYTVSIGSTAAAAAVINRGRAPGGTAT